MLRFDHCGHGARTVAGLSELASDYDVVLCDVWGVVHNGREHYPAAVEALTRFRESGGTVVLITNAPRPRGSIERMLERLRVPTDAYDAIVSSGDVTVSLILARGERPFHHLGPPRDNSLFREAAERSGGIDRRVAFSEGEYVVCTGLLDDERDTLEDYDAMLDEMLRRQMDFICANPDIVVHSGERLIYCAGAIAERYERIGGRVIQAGKPYAAIYERAIAAAAEVRAEPIARARVLAIGDGLATDLKGALNAGIDMLFVSSGIHRDRLHPEDRSGIPLDRETLAELLGEYGVAPPTGTIDTLVW
ncbi:MAG: TIGR01459 family HAD-type hydrolase [Beijerinckiaceae bacterium]